MTPKGGVSPHTKFRVSARKSEVLFTDYIAEHLTPDGRGVVIVPNGIVATAQNAYVKLRKFLIEDSLVAVVSLPAGVFRPYSGVKTSILVLDKKLARKIDNVLFLKINADGFDLGDQRRPTIENDLPEAERMVKAWRRETFKTGFETHLTFKPVEKVFLLKGRACSLQAELFFGEKVKAVSSETVALGDAAMFSNGGTPSKSNPTFWQGDIPWVSPKDMKSLIITDTEDHVSAEAIESSATKLLPAETVLCVVRSGILKHTLPVAIIARPMCTNQDILAIAPDKARLNPKFLLFVLKGRSAEILRDGIKTGVTVQSFHNGFFKTFEIPLPPLEEQHRIIDEIGSYQKIIDSARQILDAYEPRIPPGPDWRQVTFEELCERMQYGLSDPLNQNGKGVKTFRMNELVRGRAVDNGAMKRAKLNANETEKYRLAKGDVLFNRTNSIEHVGRTGIFSLDGEYVFASYLIRLSIRRDIAEPEYVNAYMNTREFQTSVKSLASRAVGQSNISASSLAGYEIPLPPLDEQRRIVAELDTEKAQLESVLALVPRFETKIQRVMDSVWGDDEDS
ncbi:MAG: hypothetical protein DMF07_00915 [Verrucomicrobia bacterium]|nr:MAG: hypothetical protein DMF07_00915 [Verrucomicrobiota bacterium]